MYDIILISNNITDQNYQILKSRFPLIKTVDKSQGNYEAYSKAKKKSVTTMFWIIEDTSEILEDFNFDYIVPEWDREYVHVFKQGDEYKGVYLIPKNYPISKREAEYNFFINNKKIDIKASKLISYDRFYVSDSNGYFEAQKKSKTSMFYVITDESVILPNFNFDYIVPEWDREYVHVFKQGDEYKGVYLIPKNYPISKREAEYNFFISHKNIDIEVSKKGFDIVFISYQEPNAEENWKKIKNRFPYVKRIHGVTGIHNAHREAAKISNTAMFWVVDGDAVITDNFNFDYFLEKWNRHIVHVWQSQNPINNLIYGYGGVKLLPRLMVLDMDMNSLDMTTSISKDFKSMLSISNVTIFNTDPFNTWKSAFRECVKLSSRSINGQVDNETTNRLNIWCTVGINNLYGEYAIKGAIAGKEFGLKYSTDKSMLSKINDWEWLTSEFNKP